jgi:membrane protein required for colicin V production
MHWLDILILVVLGVGAAMGFCTGLLWQVARVVSLGLSLYLAILTNTDAADWLGEQWRDLNPAVNRVVAFVGVFLIVYLTLYFITRAIHKIIKESKLETIDRILGALLGIAKMGAIIACICAVMVTLDLQIFKEWFEQATIAPQFAKASDIAVNWIPKDYRERVDEGVNEVRDQLQQKINDAAVDALKREVNKK